MWFQNSYGAACDLEKADMLIIDQAGKDVFTDEHGKLSYGEVTGWNVLATFPDQVEPRKKRLILTEHKTQEEAKDRVSEFVKVLKSLECPEAAQPIWIIKSLDHALNLSQAVEMRIDRDHDAKTKSYKLVAVFGAGASAIIDQGWTQEEAQEKLNGYVNALNRRM